MDMGKLMYGKVTHGTDTKSLGRATISALLLRFASEVKHVHAGTKKLVLELSVDELTDSSIQSRAVMIEAELESAIVPASKINEDWKPGISYERMGDALTSESYQAYARMCEPANRVGVDEQVITDLRTRYEAEWSDVSQYLPVWRE